MGDLRQYRDTRYYVSVDGRVINIETGKELKPSIVRGGYERVHPHINGKHRNLFVNRMVAEVFIPNPQAKPYVLHIDNNPRNNNASNLKWGTQSENIQQAYNQNRISAKGEKNGQAKLTPEDVTEMRRLRNSGLPITEIHRRFQTVSYHHIADIIHKRRWSHI